MVVNFSVELYTYSIDITQLQEHVLQFKFRKIHLIPQRFSAGEILQNTPFQNSAFRKVHLPACSSYKYFGLQSTCNIGDNYYSL